jgi:hypothetical protein
VHERAARQGVGNLDPEGVVHAERTGIAVRDSTTGSRDDRHAPTLSAARVTPDLSKLERRAALLGEDSLLALTLCVPTAPSGKSATMSDAQVPATTSDAQVPATMSAAYVTD